MTPEAIKKRDELCSRITLDYDRARVMFDAGYAARDEEVKELVKVIDKYREDSGRSDYELYKVVAKYRGEP